MVCRRFACISLSAREKIAAAAPQKNGDTSHAGGESGWGTRLATWGEEFDRRIEAAEHRAFWAAHAPTAGPTTSAPEATAISLERSAETHERIATMYEEIAERSSSAHGYREHATRHREFAHHDRQRAALLRRMATRDAEGDD